MDWELVGAILKTPFVFIGKLLRTKIGIVIVLVLAAIIFASIRGGDKSVAESRPYNETRPAIKQAPTVVQTSSRVYYVQKYVDDGKVLTLVSFYYFDKDKWEKNNLPLPIDRGVYGEVRIIPRSN